MAHPSPLRPPITLNHAAVVVVGSLNMDLVAGVDQLPRPGETVIGTGFTVTPGGKGANQAVAAARTGARVQMVACLGEDAHGEQLLDTLRTYHVDCSGVARTGSAATGVALISVARHGENCIVVVPGANEQLSLRHVRDCGSMIARAGVVVAQLECPVTVVAEALRIARANGVVTVLNAAPAGAPLAPDLLALVDWLIVNESEARGLTGLALDTVDDARPIAAELMRQGAGAVLVTLGARGVLLCDREGAWHLPALQVEALDTTGAGDTFVGAFSARLARGEPAAAAAHFAQTAAALAVSRAGCMTAIPHLEEVLGFQRARAVSDAAVDEEAPPAHSNA